MSFKRRLVVTIILMVLIPALLLGLLALAMLTSMFIGHGPAGPASAGIVQVDRDALRAQIRPGGEMFVMMIIWAVSAIACVTASFSAGVVYISRRLLKPLHELRGVVSSISAGNLDVEVLGTGVMEVDELCSAIDELRVRLKRTVSDQVASEHERSLMLANLSHDLRTPVTAIKGYADGLREGVAATPEMRERYIGTIYSRASDMERMIEQASDFSELELGRMRFDFTPIDGAAFMRELALDFATDFEASGAELVFESSCGRTMINADQLKLRRVFANLFSNALKYRREDRPLRVAVRVSAGGGSMRTVVADNGAGVAADSTEKVFEGFYRTDPARRGTRGHGLGLAIAKQIIERHGGRIWLQSHEGEGTEVYVTIPLIDNADRRTQNAEDTDS